MKPFQRIFIILFILCCSTKFVTAQDNYIRSIGLRGGPIFGVSYKHFIGVPAAIEGIAGFNFTNGRLVSLTGLYEYHFMINYQLNVYGGGGLTLAFNENNFRVPFETLVGIEYTIPWFPLNVSFDYKPAFRIFQGEFIFNEFGISARVIF